jgi:uncharacterized protein YegL
MKLNNDPLQYAFNKVSELNDEFLSDASPTIVLSVLVSLTDESKGDMIQALNSRLPKFVDKLNSKVDNSIELSIVTTHEYATVQRPNYPLMAKSSLPLIAARGHKRALGQGMEVSLNILRTRVRELQFQAKPVRKPWLIVITDGSPTDVWEDTAFKLKHWSSEKSVVPIIINTGEPDSLLQQFSEIPVFDIQPSELNSTFNWVIESLTRISQAQSGSVKLSALPQ